MNKNKEISDGLAIHILTEGIERCKKSLRNLEIGTEDFDNVFLELRSYQRQKTRLLKGGGASDRP